MSVLSSSSSTSLPGLSLRRVLTGLVGLALCGGAVLVAAPAAAQTPTAIIFRPTAPKQKKGDRHEGTIITTPLKQSDVGELKVGGKVTDIKAWTPLFGGDYSLQLVVLLDSMEQIGINEQFDDIRKLFDHLPPNTEIAVGYLLQGKAKITQTFTTDRKLAGAALKEPQDTASPKNNNGDPYQCLRDLATHWPNPSPKKIRAVLMITDGIDRSNNFQNGDQDDPDVISAAASLVHAGIIPFPFFYLDPVVPQGRSEGGAMEGQANFDVLTSTTGGVSLYEGQYAPGTFDPLLEKMFGALESMTVATVDLPGKGYKQIDVKPANDTIGIRVPDGVTIGNVLKTKAK